MSKYHPLDVRHPANRDLERRNYLLEPIAQPAPAAPAEKPARAARRTSPPPAQAPAQVAASPWGRPKPSRRGAQPAVTPAPEQAGSGFGGFLRSLFIVAVIVTLLATQTNLLDPLLTEIRFRALDLGIRLPF